MLRLLPLVATRRVLFLETVSWSAVTHTTVLGIAFGVAWSVGHVVADRPLPVAAVGVLLCALAVLASATAWRESWVSHDLAYRLIATLRGHVFDALRRSLPPRSRHRRTGDLTTTVVADIETLEWLYAHTAGQTLSALLVVGISAAVSLSISPLLLLVWIPLLAIWVAVPAATANRAEHDGDQLAGGAAALRSDLLDTIRGIRELTGSGALKTQLERLTDEARALARIQTREASRLGAERAIADAALALAAIGAVLIVVLDGAAVAPQHVPLAVTVAVAGLGPAAQIADLLRNASTLLAATERISAVLDEPPALDDVSCDPLSVRVGESGLVFDGVGFAYDGTTAVLDDFTMCVRPGEVVALVGASGAGKTTAARLALRLWDPDVGTVRIDGRDLRQFPDAELRRAISAVPQSSPLLRGTVGSNIVLGNPDATEAAIHRAATATGLLDADAQLPDGLDTPVGEHGAGLSGGQRARVALARALLDDPRVLVLDEPTASLDPGADAAIMELLARSGERAVLLIAHRPATIAAADRVVELRRR